MKKIIILSSTLFFLIAENNTTTIDSNKTRESNSTKKMQHQKSKAEENLAKAIAQEKRFKKEQKFYQGEDYNLSEKEIDPSSLEKIKPIEPDYDYEMLEF